MINTGLVSITFRQLTPQQIVELVSQANLDSIEWGGDIHVPHGDIACANEVRQMTEAAGLATAAYGSYYRVAQSEADGLAFESVLETAVALGAPLIRVWPGARGSAAADAAYRDLVADESRRIAELAQQAGIVVAYEYHGGTLTDTPASARALLEQVAHPNLRTLWQPNGTDVVAEQLDGLHQVIDWLTNVHVFHWARAEDGSAKRLPLADGAAAWRDYFDAMAGREFAALIEFVEGDEPEQFLRDAAVLREWVGAIGPGG